MRHLFVIALAVMLAMPVAAQDFDKGWTASKRGDYATAMREWRPLAEQGDATAQHNLGLMYHKGQGVLQDNAEAMKWFRKAAEQGEALAQSALGIMYREGQGVPQDFVQAHMWLNLSAAQGWQGNAEDAKIRDALAKLMTPSDVSKAQKMTREWSAKHGKAK